ncbi:Long chronological lifespan protein 2 [Bienertia sinuspersici]
MLVAWIVNTLDVSVCSTVRFPDHVKTLWNDLRDRYSLGNGPRILELKSQIVDCKQRGRPMAIYLGELRKLQDELASYCKIPSCMCTAASEYAKIGESELLHQFCIGLDSKKFGSVVSTLLMMDPVPPLNVAYAKVVADERKQTVSEAHDSHSEVAIGFAASGSAPFRSARSGSGDGRVCEHCGRRGHDKDKCFELMGWPDRVVNTGAARGPGRSGRSHGRGGVVVVDPVVAEVVDLQQMWVAHSKVVRQKWEKLIERVLQP